MSDTTPSRGFSPWWAVLLLPVCLLIGWYVGQAPDPGSNRPAAAAEAETEAKASLDAVGSTTTTPPPAFAPTPSAEPDPPAPAAPRGEVSSWTTLEHAMEESSRNGKPILIDFNAEWCGPCQTLKQEVFDDWNHGKAVQTAVIPVSIVDRTREDGANPPEIESLKKQFGVDAFPTLIVLSPATGRVMRAQGYGGAERTTAWIIESAQAVK